MRSSDIEDLRKQAMQSGEVVPGEQKSDRLRGMTAEQIEKIVEDTRSQVMSKSRFYEVKVCGGAFGCPRSLFDVGALAEKMVAIIEDTGVPQAVPNRVSGPIPRHHKLCIALSGCPNSCAQPRIADFGIQGRARPEVGPGACTGCGECVRICQEASVNIGTGGPVFDRSRCIDCGDCSAVCPVEAIVNNRYGFSVLAGGKLGRHPRLASTLFELADEETALASLRAVCSMFIHELNEGERLGNALDRILPSELIRRINQSAPPPRSVVDGT